jgi:uncharacterized lipoprotein YbaY
MSPNIAGTIRTVTVALGTFVGLTATTAMAQSIQGTATYRERMALSPSAVFEATLEGCIARRRAGGNDQSDTTNLAW